MNKVIIVKFENIKVKKQSNLFQRKYGNLKNKTLINIKFLYINERKEKGRK